MYPRPITLVAAAVALFGSPSLPAAAPCADSRPLYMHIEPVKSALGVRGETRARYLDRRFGAGKWAAGGDERARITAPAAEDAPLRITFGAADDATSEHAELIVEARLDYVGDDHRQTVVHGHRELRSFALPADAESTIEVPLTVFREPGALLIVMRVTRRGEPAAPGLQVREWPVPPRGCERRVYTHDRFTAIRLNQKAAR